MATRDDYVYQATLAEQAERYDEMVESMKCLVGLGQELTAEERNLLSVAYKNLIGVRRVPWRTISAIESKEEAKGSAKKAILTEYRKQIEEELISICLDIIDMLDKLLIPASQNGESKVFYYEMKGDYYRYLAGFVSENERDEYVEKSLIAFKAASDIAEGIHVRETN